MVTTFSSVWLERFLQWFCWLYTRTLIMETNEMAKGLPAFVFCSLLYTYLLSHEIVSSTTLAAHNFNSVDEACKPFWQMFYRSVLLFVPFILFTVKSFSMSSAEYIAHNLIWYRGLLLKIGQLRELPAAQNSIRKILPTRHHMPNID